MKTYLKITGTYRDGGSHSLIDRHGTDYWQDHRIGVKGTNKYGKIYKGEISDKNEEFTLEDFEIVDKFETINDLSLEDKLIMNLVKEGKRCDHSGFNSFGKLVPGVRMQKGYETVKEMLNCDNELASYIVGKCSELIKQDKPFEIVGAIEGLDKDLAKIDLTGRYRLLAVLVND